jgi:hypothetical protein
MRMHRSLPHGHSCSPVIRFTRFLTDVELLDGDALKNIQGSHFKRHGRPERTRTVDLYRVKVAL